jgi:hypothetical protein
MQPARIIQQFISRVAPNQTAPLGQLANRLTADVTHARNDRDTFAAKSDMNQTILYMKTADLRAKTKK